MDELASWAGASAAIVTALAWVVLPGLPAVYAGGLRGITAWGTAPVISIGSMALGAVVAGRLGVGWSGWAAVAPALVLALLAAGLRLALSRRRPPGDARPPAYGWPRTGSRADTDGRAVTLGAVAGMVVAAIIGMFTLTRGFGAPSALSQTYDAVFHYNAVAHVLATGDASSLTLGTLNIPGAQSAFYPAAWHDLVSLVVLSTGASIPLATNVVAGVVAAFVWPLACTVLVRQVAGASWAAVALAPVLAFGFIAYPWTLLSFGVLWPNLLGIAMVPVGLAAVVALCGLGTSSITPLRAVALLPVVVVTLGLAHPNTVFSLAVLAVPPVAWWFARRMGAVARGGRPVLAGAAVVAVLVVAAVAVQVLLTSPLFDGVRAHDWPAWQSPPQAVGEVALGATNGREAAWTVAVVVLAGLLAAWRVPDHRWLILAHVASGGLFLLASALETPLAETITAIWYNDSHRLAAMIPITGVPLAVLGLLAIGSAVHARWPAGPRRPDGSILGIAAAALVVVASSGMYVGDHSEIVGEAYPPPEEPVALLAASQRAFYESVGPLITPGSVVAANPWSGSPLLWALTGRQVLFPHLDGEWTPDQLYLAQHLRDVEVDPRVCPVAERLDVRYLLVSELDFWPNDRRVQRYPGLTAPDGGFREVASDGIGNALYELTGCAAPATRGSG